MLRRKSPAKKLYVTYKQRQFRQWQAVRNFQDVIREIVLDYGLDGVKALALKLEGHDLIQVGGSTALASKNCGDYHLAVHSDVDEKAEVLRQMKRALNLDMEVRVLRPAEWQAQIRDELLR